MKIVILGLSITSSWGNGHATTYRALVNSLEKLGHNILFLERDQPWYAENRDLPKPPFGRTEIYTSFTDLKTRFEGDVIDADLVIVGSYVPEGILVGEWCIGVAGGTVAFYDIDTPVTLAKLDKGECDYLSRSLVMRYDLYLSFTGGPTLEKLEKKYYSPRARVLYCSVDPAKYYVDEQPIKWDAGYLGTYSDDRQPALERLLLQPAREWADGRFCVAGPMYPPEMVWPSNVERITHLNPREHRAFYNSQRWTINVTRANMVQAGYSPSVRLFEAAACGVPILSDRWEGIEDVLTPGSEVLIADTAEEALAILRDLPDTERRAIADRARTRVLAKHTSDYRAKQLENYALELARGSVADKAAR